MIGYQEMIIIFLIVLLLFGGKKIPEIARGLGKGLREFRKARDDIKYSIDREAKEDEKREEDKAENDDLKEA
jgi:sec-independent protein translocase protein TatA